MTREELLPIAKPILFNTEMVQAILEGRKTVTRRLPSSRVRDKWFDYEEYVGMVAIPGSVSLREEEFYKEYPPYAAGDYLYVRETWHKYIKRVGKGETCHLAEFYGYKASIANSEDAHEPWKPSIHMPKEAARLFLKVNAVRVERLQDITISEMKKEGLIDECEYCTRGIDCNVCIHEDGIIDEWQELWNSTIKKSDVDKYGWEANPWVWVIEFERVEVE